MAGWHHWLNAHEFEWTPRVGWWWTGRPGVLRFMGLQRVGHGWATELNWKRPTHVHEYMAQKHCPGGQSWSESWRGPGRGAASSCVVHPTASFLFPQYKIAASLWYGGYVLHVLTDILWTFLWPVLAMAQEPVWAYRVAQTSGNRFSNSPGLCRGVFFVLFYFFSKSFMVSCERKSVHLNTIS